MTVSRKETPAARRHAGRHHVVAAPAANLAEQMARTVRLAAPVVVARSGVLVLAAVDTAMTGRAGAQELAYLGLGIAPTIPILLIGIGTLQGTAILGAQALGAGKPEDCGAVWRTGLKLAVIIGTLLGLLCLLGEPFLRAIGQDPVLAAGGGRVMAMMSWNIGAILLFSATSLFLESINRPLPGMVVMIAVNIANIGLNWMFIYGNAGVPALGAVGAVIATGLVRWAGVLVLVGYVLVMADGDLYGVRSRGARFTVWGGRMLRLGLPMGVARGVESSAFMTMVMMAGFLGAASLGGYQIASNLLALVFMGAIGTGTATAVWVGQAVGRGDSRGVALAGWAGALVAVILMGVFGLVFALAPGGLAGFYSSDAPVLAAATAAITVASMFLVFDGIQAVLMGALRGVGDVWVPMSLQVMSFWLLSVPMAALLTFGLGWGVRGLMGGIFVGVVNAALVLGWRFHVVSRREVRRY